MCNVRKHESGTMEEGVGLVNIYKVNIRQALAFCFRRECDVLLVCFATYCHVAVNSNANHIYLTRLKAIH